MSGKAALSGEDGHAIRVTLAVLGPRTIQLQALFSFEPHPKTRKERTLRSLLSYLLPVESDVRLVSVDDLREAPLWFE